MSSTLTSDYATTQAPWDLATYYLFHNYVDNYSKPVLSCAVGDEIEDIFCGSPDLTEKEVRTGWYVSIALCKVLRKALEKPTEATEATETEETATTDSTASYPIFGYNSLSEYSVALCQFYESASRPIKADHDAFKALADLNTVLDMSLSNGQERGQDYLTTVMNLQNRVRCNLHTLIQSVNEASDQQMALRSILSLQNNKFFTDSMLIEAAAHTYIACRNVCADMKGFRELSGSFLSSIVFLAPPIGSEPAELERLTSWLATQDGPPTSASTPFNTKACS